MTGALWKSDEQIHTVVRHLIRTEDLNMRDVPAVILALLQEVGECPPEVDRWLREVIRRREKDLLEIHTILELRRRAT